MGQPEYVTAPHRNRMPNGATMADEALPPNSKPLLNKPAVQSCTDSVGLHPASSDLASSDLGVTRPSRFGTRFGHGGPDQGYALKLASRFKDKLSLDRGEHVEDALRAGVSIATARASMFGRAPVNDDVRFALYLLGFLGDAPATLKAERKSIVVGARHSYQVQRRAASAVNPRALKMSPDEVATAVRNDKWEELLNI